MFVTQIKENTDLFSQFRSVNPLCNINSSLVLKIYEASSKKKNYWQKRFSALFIVVFGKSDCSVFGYLGFKIINFGVEMQALFGEQKRLVRGLFVLTNGNVGQVGGIPT